MKDNHLDAISLEISSKNKTAEDVDSKKSLKFTEKIHFENKCSTLTEIRQEGPTVLFLAFLYFLHSIPSGFSSSIPLYD